MRRRDIGTDDHRVKVRPGKGTRPRTKIRPDYSSKPRGQVYRIDRGRYHVRLLNSQQFVTAVKARELPHRSVAIGDICALTGDLSGRAGSLARIVAIDPRKSSLRRSSAEEDNAGAERVMVANADQLIIVAALARPELRFGMIDRCLVAAYDGQMQPVLLLTKCDLADPAPVISHYEMLGFPILTSAFHSSHLTVPPSQDAATPPAALLNPDTLQKIKTLTHGKSSVLVGHSGVGKSTLINALLPSAARVTGAVNEVTGRGRHTSTAAVAFDLPDGGVIVDTPGVRTFGLAHVGTTELLKGFPDLTKLAHECPRGCTHQETEPECAFDLPENAVLSSRISSFRRLLLAASKPSWE